MKRILFTATMGLAAGIALAATPAYTFKFQFDTTASGTRMTCATATSAGNIYFADNNSDKIYYLAFASPIETTTESNIQTVYDASTPPDPFGSGSWGGITVDSAGTVFASGNYSGTTNVMAKITGSVGSWTTTFLTLPPGIELLGGCSAVGVNKLVAPGYTSGKLHFLTVNPSTNVVTEDVGSPVNGPASFTGTAPAAVYDATNGRIYMSHNVSGTSTGGIYAFTSNGTPAGTSYNAAVNPLVADTTGVSGSNSIQYQSISVNPADKVVATARNNSTITGGNGWQLVDAATLSANKTPYQFIDGTGSTTGQLPGTDTAMGHTFFTISGTRYYITGTEDAARKFMVWTAGSAVSDWSIY